MGLGYKQISKVICIACSEPIGEHRKRELARCLFRIQGTMVSNGIDDNQSNSQNENENEPVENIRGFDIGVG